LDGFIALAQGLGTLTGMAGSAPIYATVSGLHVFGIALLVGPILIVDLVLLRIIQGFPTRGLETLRNAAKVGTVLALATGLFLFTARPAEYVTNWAFVAKLAVIAHGLANAIVFEVAARRYGLAVLMIAPAARFAAGFSITVWLVTIALGRWTAFV